MMNILTTKGYFERFFWHLQNGCKYHKQAYELVEDERKQLNAPRKYEDYGSFRRAKCYHFKKKGRI